MCTLRIAGELTPEDGYFDSPQHPPTLTHKPSNKILDRVLIGRHRHICTKHGKEKKGDVAKVVKENLESEEDEESTE